MLLLAACGDVPGGPTDTADTQDTRPQEEIPESLPAVTDDTAEQVKEIVVGKTNRERDGEFP